MKKTISLKAQLIIMITCFIGICLFVLSFFQLFLIDDVYKSNKINSIKEIEKNIHDELIKDNLNGSFSSISPEDNVAVRVISSDFDLYYGNSDYSFSLNKLTDRDIESLAHEINNTESKKLLVEMDVEKTNDDIAYIYGEAVEYNGSNVLILVSTLVTPLTATKNTIAFEYIFIAIILTVTGILFALLISKTILEPVENINAAAKKLPQGKYINVDCSQFELNELNETLIDANQRIIKADKAKKELLANVSHDLKTPLTMISGYAEMIKDLPDSDHNEYASVIIEESKRISVLVDDLVDLSLLEENVLNLHKEDITFSSIMYDVYNQYKSICLKNKINFDLKIDVDFVANVDEGRIKQVLYNFINNAINYNDKDEKKIELGVNKFGDNYHVYVLDNGKGIDEKDLENIWDRYYKVDKTHQRARVGSGIGLAITKKVLDEHKFKYGVKSKLGEYSEFYFELPIKQTKKVKKED